MVNTYKVFLQVNPSSVSEFEVADLDSRLFVVNLEEKTCYCRQFQVDQFVCPHAVAACRERGLSVYDYVSPYYFKEKLKATYAGVVHPIGTEHGIQVPEEIKSRVVRKPVTNPKSGRPKTKRMLSTGETPCRQKCSRCGQSGHNRQTCRHPIPVRSTTFQASNARGRRRQRTEQE